MQPFFNYYDAGKVVIFFLELNRNHPREIIEQFINYHSEPVLHSWKDLFPRPDLWDIWWRWISLPPTMRTDYVKINIPEWKKPLF